MINGQDYQKKLDKLLQKSQVRRDPRRSVIYGVVSDKYQGMFVRLDNFLIDHQKISLQEKAYFFHLLAIMIESGVPMIMAMRILAERTESIHLARILNTIAYNLKQGLSLSVAMSRFSDVFGEMELGIIKSGEAAGNLDKMLLRLSVQLDKSNQLVIKLVTASIYPLAVIVVLLVAATAMMTFVIPNLIALLKEGGLKERDFPAMTKLLIAISALVTNYWWLILIVFLFLYFLFKFWSGTEDGKYKWDIFKLRFPVLGELLRKVYILRFVSILGILLESGLSVIKALEIVAQSMSSETYALKTWEVISRVKVGEKISDSLSDTPFLFPSSVTEVLAVAEQTASIGKISEKIANQYDVEIDNSLKRLTSLFEPIMIIFVGVSVAMLALAILMPVFKLTAIVGS